MTPRTAPLRIVPLAGGLLLVLGSLVARPVEAAEPEQASASAAPEDTNDAAADAGATSWGPIVGACLGVLFGGALALWQIRGMKNRG